MVVVVELAVVVDIVVVLFDVKLIVTALVLVVVVVVDKGVEVVVIMFVIVGWILNVVGAVVVSDISEDGFAAFFSASHKPKMQRNTIMKIVVSF